MGASIPINEMSRSSLVATRSAPAQLAHRWSSAAEGLQASASRGGGNRGQRPQVRRVASRRRCRVCAELVEPGQRRSLWTCGQWTPSFIRPICGPSYLPQRLTPSISQPPFPKCPLSPYRSCAEHGSDGGPLSAAGDRGWADSGAPAAFQRRGVGFAHPRNHDVQRRRDPGRDEVRVTLRLCCSRPLTPMPAKPLLLQHPTRAPLAAAAVILPRLSDSVRRSHGLRGRWRRRRRRRERRLGHSSLEAQLDARRRSPDGRLASLDDGAALRKDDGRAGTTTTNARAAPARRRPASPAPRRARVGLVPRGLLGRAPAGGHAAQQEQRQLALLEVALALGKVDERDGRGRLFVSFFAAVLAAHAAAAHAGVCAWLARAQSRRWCAAAIEPLSVRVGARAFLAAPTGLHDALPSDREARRFAAVVSGLA